MKKKQRISDLFYDNRFLFVFSLFIAVGFWLVASVEFGTEVTEIIKGVPVQIDYEKTEKNFGLEPFGETNFTVNVTVSGKKYIVDSDDIADDIIITTSTVVSSPGTHSLKLDVATKSDRPAYDIIGISKDEIEVYFDYSKTKEFLVETDIQIADNAVAEGYCLGDYVFQEANKVSVSGPETQVSKIEKVIASAAIDESISENTTVNALLSVITKDGSTANYIKFNRKSGYLQITIPVYKISTLSVECGFSNIPIDYINSFPFKVTVEPSSAVFGIPEKKLEGITGFEIETIDFSQLHSGINTFDVYASDISGVKVLDGTEKFTVTVDMGTLSSEMIEAPSNVSFNNVPSGLKAELVSLNFTYMTVYGPKASVEAINKDDMVLVADLENIDESVSGEVMVPVTFSTSDCWSYGSYIATLNVS